MSSSEGKGELQLCYQRARTYKFQASIRRCVEEAHLNWAWHMSHDVSETWDHVSNHNRPALKKTCSSFSLDKGLICPREWLRWLVHYLGVKQVALLATSIADYSTLWKCQGPSNVACHIAVMNEAQMGR